MNIPHVFFVVLLLVGFCNCCLFFIALLLVLSLTPTRTLSCMDSTFCDSSLRTSGQAPDRGVAALELGIASAAFPGIFFPLRMFGGSRGFLLADGRSGSRSEGDCFCAGSRFGGFFQHFLSAQVGLWLAFAQAWFLEPAFVRCL